MVRIQLESGYLNVKEGTKLPLNFGVADVRDISKRSGTFSKTITLIGDDNNNQLLGHYYDVNIQAGTFNIDTLTKCSVIQNGVPIVEDAFLQLVSINKEQHSDGHEEKVEYSVLIKDAQSDFFTKLDNNELTDLDFTDLNHTFNSTNIVASFAHTVTDGYVYPVCANPSNIYSITTLRPAIYAKYYFDRIHSNAGFSYEWADLSTDNFDKAVIPYNGDKPQVNYDDYILRANKLSFVPTLSTALTGWTENEDNQNVFNPTTGVYTPPFYIAQGQAVNFEVEVDLDFELVNATGADAYLVDSSVAVGDQDVKYYAEYVVYKNGNPVSGGYFGGNPLGGANNVERGEWSEADNPLPNGTTNVGDCQATINVAVSNLLPTDSLTFGFRILPIYSTSSSQMKWRDSNSVSGAEVTIAPQLNVSSVRMIGRVSVNTFGFGQEVDMNLFIPKKIKQKDFIKWILFRWNLYVEQDKDNPNKFIYKSRDKYYDEGSEKNWTSLLSKERPQQLKFLPELSAKKILLTDKLDKDSYNVVYNDAINEVYGQLEFTYSNEYVKGIDKKETIFSPTPMIRTTFNAVVPSINGNAPQNNIRLLLHNGTATCDSYQIIDYGTTGTTQLKYPVVSHFDNNENPTFDLNFGVCDYYFYDNFTKTNNNMYNLFWRRTINQINTGKMLVGYFDLNEGDIQTLELSDKIRIDNSWWNINRVIDYDANGETLTKVELLSVDTEIELTPFEEVTPNTPTPVIANDPAPPLIDNFYADANVNYSQGSTTVKGTGNTVNENIRAFVVGDNGLIDQDGFWYNGERLLSPSELADNKPQLNLIEVSSDYTVDITSESVVVARSSGITITLPNPALNQRYRVYIKNYSGGNITVDSNGTPSDIDGDTCLTLSNRESVTLVSTKDRYYIV